MEENMNNQNTETVEKTFTQDEVNRIIGERLSKEKAKSEADFSKREQDLQQREMAVKAKELLAERGLPKDLASVLRYSDEESLTKAIDSIQSLRGFKEEPNTNNNNNKKVIIENRLPDGITHETGNDPFKKAFNLTRED